jgi:hypothetical protein
MTFGLRRSRCGDDAERPRYPGQARKAARMAGTVTRIRTVPPRTVQSAAEAFLDTIGSPNTRRTYTIAIVKTTDRLDGRGPQGLDADSRALAAVTDAEIGAALEALWGSAAVNTWNARRAAVVSG